MNEWIFNCAPSLLTCELFSNCRVTQGRPAEAGQQSITLWTSVDTSHLTLQTSDTACHHQSYHATIKTALVKWNVLFSTGEYFCEQIFYTLNVSKKWFFTEDWIIHDRDFLTSEVLKAAAASCPPLYWRRENVTSVIQTLLSCPVTHCTEWRTSTLTTSVSSSAQAWVREERMVMESRGSWHQTSDESWGEDQGWSVCSARRREPRWDVLNPRVRKLIISTVATLTSVWCSSLVSSRVCAADTEITKLVNQGETQTTSTAPSVNRSWELVAR